MPKPKRLVALLIAVISISAWASPSASAGTAEWMLGGSTFAEEGQTTAALNTTAKTDKAYVLSSSGLTISCTGTLESEKPEIVKTSIAKAEALIFTSCKATTPTACAVPTTIGTVPVEGESTLDGTTAVKAIVHPRSGKVFTTISVTGSECSAAGNKPVTGDAEVLAPVGQEERTDQLLEAKQGSTGLLKLGSEAASLAGSSLLLLANGAAWSFLASGRESTGSAEWMLGEKTLAEEGQTVAALKTTAKTDKSELLSSAGLTDECVGNLEAIKPEITTLNVAKAEALIFTACKATSPIACTVPTTIGTVPVEGEVTLDGALAVKGTIKPQSGKVFTTIAVTGAECAAAGNKPVTGDFEVLAPEGQDERTDQRLEFKQGATGLLKLGSESLKLEGAVLLLLANAAAWSFL